MAGVPAISPWERRGGRGAAGGCAGREERLLRPGGRTGAVPVRQGAGPIFLSRDRAGRTAVRPVLSGTKAGDRGTASAVLAVDQKPGRQGPGRESNPPVEVISSIDCFPQLRGSGMRGGSSWRTAVSWGKHLLRTALAGNSLSDFLRKIPEKKLRTLTQALSNRGAVWYNLR